jgi:hypothetical protein
MILVMNKYSKDKVYKSTIDDINEGEIENYINEL